MTAQHDFHTLPFCGMAIYKTTDSQTDEKTLADKIAFLSTDIVTGFDRTLWADLSSGQMPPQLYLFPNLNCDNKPQAPQNTLIVFFKEGKDFAAELQNFNSDFTDLLTQTFAMPFPANPQGCGTIEENAFEEEDFSDSYYLSFINWEANSSELSTPQSCCSFQLSADDKFATLCFSKDLNIQENWLEDIFGVYSKDQNKLHGNSAILAGYFFFPARQILAELDERSRDKEKIHQAAQISGTRC